MLETSNNNIVLFSKMMATLGSFKQHSGIIQLTKVGLVSLGDLQYQEAVCDLQSLRPGVVPGYL